jgi:hypothetical protein
MLIDKTAIIPSEAKDLSCIPFFHHHKQKSGPGTVTGAAGIFFLA